MLPLGHATLIERLLEQLVRTGLTEIDIVACVRPELLRDALGDGERWGIRLRWHLARDPDRPYAMLRSSFCAGEPGPLNTAAVMQHFASTGHDAVLSAALASAHDHALAIEHVESQLREGAARWRQHARRAGAATPPPESGLSAEEAERLRQLEIVRRGRPARSVPDAET